MNDATFEVKVGRESSNLPQADKGVAHKLQATTRSSGLFRIELPPPASDPNFLCKTADKLESLCAIGDSQ